MSNGSLKKLYYGNEINMAEEDPLEKKRRLNTERQQKWRARQSEEKRIELRKVDAVRKTLRIQNESEEQATARRAAQAQSERTRLLYQTPEEAEVRRIVHAQSERTRLLYQTPEEAEVRRIVHGQSQRTRLLNQTPEEADVRRIVNAQSQRTRLLKQTPEEAEVRRIVHAQSQRARLINQTPEEAEARRAAHAQTQRSSLINQTPEEAEARQANDVVAHRLAQEHRSQAIRDEAFHFDEGQVSQFNCGPMNVPCQFCGSRNFAAERPSDGKFNSCCRKGKVKLEKPLDATGNALHYPDFLRTMLSTPDHPSYRHFRENIRSYNSAVSFASMGAKVVDFHGGGPYVFKVHGQICHRTSHILPVNDQTALRSQLYVVDSTQATEIRTDHPANERCYPRILDEIDRFFRQHNRLADSYRMLREVEERATREASEVGEEIPVVNMVFRRDRHSDQRRYNAPNSNEIAMVFENKDGEPPFERDIRVYPSDPENPENSFINISILSPNLDPMAYPLLFPFGEAGWQPNWRCESYEGAQSNRSRVNVSMLQYKAALTAVRADFNPRISAGKLTQQWIVDSYLQVEANNLNFIRQNQKQLRTELYQGLADHMENVAQNAGLHAGIPVILPSSFEGSPRNMRERCADAMSIFAKLGAPDLFITFTANPKWSEISDNLHLGEQVSDRPDLVARVFRLKLKSLLQDLTVHGVLGKSVAFVYTIEFQKRGLPHAHILVTLCTKDRFTSADRIDEVICAEIPDETSSPRLRDIVARCMMHGPCGTSNPKAPCMEDGKCKKSFPKKFQELTEHNVDGYPKYRRRDGITVQVRGATMDNRYVVPYNPYLLLKYDAHINVEVCTSLRAVKYIYKYIYKGFDCANLAITAGQNPEVRHNEVANYIDARYVSAPEAMWRLLESPMHDRSDRKRTRLNS